MFVEEKKCGVQCQTQSSAFSVSTIDGQCNFPGPLLALVAKDIRSGPPTLLMTCGCVGILVSPDVIQLRLVGCRLGSKVSVDFIRRQQFCFMCLMFLTVNPRSRISRYLSGLASPNEK